MLHAALRALQSGSPEPTDAARARFRVRTARREVALRRQPLKLDRRTAIHDYVPAGGQRFCGLETSLELADPVQQLASEHSAGVVEPEVTA